MKSVDVRKKKRQTLNILIQLEDLEKLKEDFLTLEKRLESRLSIISNGIQYGGARLEATRDMAKNAYDFLCTSEQFCDWYKVKQFLKEIDDGC